MSRGRLLVAAVVLVVLAGGGAWAYSALSGPAFTNPVLRHDAPDPSVIKAGDGFYYAYTTQSEYGAKGLVHLPILRSDDLIDWDFVRDALPRLPDWVATDTWAPHITRIGSRYLLYYSAQQFGRAGFGIGIATSAGPGGPFRDSGRAILRGPGFTTIDPFVLTVSDPEHYIYWGSSSAPIRARRLSPDGMCPVGKAKIVLEPSEEEYSGLIEGPWIVRHDDFYYLMYSGDDCCEPAPHYAVLVARSRSPLGPFEKHPDNPILELNRRFYGPGHNSTIRDEAGRDWMLYHSFVGDVSEKYLGDHTTRSLMLDLIEWDDGWPVVNGGEGPSKTSADAPEV